MGIVCCSYIGTTLSSIRLLWLLLRELEEMRFWASQLNRKLEEYLICFDATKFVLLSVSTPLELPKNSTISFSVDLWRSKTFLLELAITATLRLHSKFLRLEVLHPFIFSVPYTLEWQNLFSFAQNCDKVHFVSLRNADALDGLFLFVCFSFFTNCSRESWCILIPKFCWKTERRGRQRFEDFDTIW